MPQKFMPAVDSLLVIELPGETLRAMVRKVQTDDVVTVEIVSTPLARTGHTYRLGDQLAVMRQVRPHGEAWVPRVVRMESAHQKPNRNPPPVPQKADTGQHKTAMAPKPEKQKVKRRIAM